MSLLKLTPESERLRRIAKAHAAGELSQVEFRQIRTQVIDGFGASGQMDLGDDTQPRWRGSDVTTQRYVAAIEGSIDAEPQRWPLRLVGAAMLLILVAIAAVGSL